MSIEHEKSANRVRLNFWLSKSMYQFIEYVGIRDGRSMSDVVREALRDYMQKDTKNHPQPLGDDIDGRSEIR